MSRQISETPEPLKTYFETFRATPTVSGQKAQRNGNSAGIASRSVAASPTNPILNLNFEPVKIDESEIEGVFIFDSLRCYVPELKEIRNICRTCYRAIVDGNLFRLFEANSANLRDMLSLVLVNIDLYISRDAAICLQCKNSLESSYKFLKKWKESEQRFKKLTRQHSKHPNLVVFPEKRTKISPNFTPNILVAASDFGLKLTSPNSDNSLVVNTNLNPSSGLNADSSLIDHDYVLPPVSILESLLQKKRRNHKTPAPKKLLKPKKKFDFNLKLNREELSKQVKKRKKTPENVRLLCQICGVVLKSRAGFLRHSKRHRETYKCDRCDYVTNDKQTLKKHSIKHLELLYQCENCDKKFNEKGKLKKHVDYVHLGISDEIQCHVCGKQFKHKSTLRLHMLVHRGNEAKKYKCGICSKGFLTKHKRQTHLESHNQSSFACQFCDKKLKYERSLHNHIAIFHENKGKHRCETCNQAYWKNSDLKRHLLRGGCETLKRSKSGAVIPRTDCDICGKVFGSRIRLYVHKKSHTNSTFSCSICGRKFKYEKSLEKHVDIFHGNRGRYKCELCDKGYWKSQDLLKHRLKFHVEVFDDSSENSNAEIVSLHVEHT